MTRLAPLALLLVFGCGSAPERATPASAPTTQPADALPNDGTRKVGDVTKCPVSGDVFKVEADSPKVTHEGKTYFMCCKGCVKKFDPAKLGATAPTTQPADVLPNDGTRKVGDITRCPVSGHTFKATAESPSVFRDGKRYFLCCPGCVDKFEANPAKYTAN